MLQYGSNQYVTLGLGILHAPPLLWKLELQAAAVVLNLSNGSIKFTLQVYHRVK